MMDETSDRLAALLRRTNQLEARLGVGAGSTSKKDGNPPVKKTKPANKDGNNSPTPNKLKLNKGKKKTVYREKTKKKAIKKDKFFANLHLSSSEDDCSEISSICAPCESSGVGHVKEFPGSSLSVAYSTNYGTEGRPGIGKSEESMELELEVARQALLSNLSEGSQNFSDILSLAGSIGMVQDSQKSYISETTNNDLVEDQSSVGSRNISDVLRDADAVEVIPESQQCTREESLDNSKNLTKSSVNDLSFPLSEDSGLQSAVPSSKDNPEDLEQSVLVLSNRLDQLLTKKPSKVQSAKKKKRTKKVSGSSSGSVPTIPEVKERKRTENFGTENEINHEEYSFSVKNKKPHQNQASNRDLASSKKNMFCHSVIFSSEDDEQVDKCLQIDNWRQNVHKHLDLGTPTRSPIIRNENTKSRATPKKKVAPVELLQAVEFSSEDEVVPQQAVCTQRNQQTESRTYSSGSSVNPADDITQLSQRLDSILLGKSNKPSTKKKTKKTVSKTKKTKKGANKMLLLPDFSSEEDVFSDKTKDDPVVCNISLQVSMPSTGSSVNQSSLVQEGSPALELTNKSLQVSLGSSVSSEQSVKCSNKSSGSDSHDLAESNYSNKCLQISLSSTKSSSPENSGCSENSPLLDGSPLESMDLTSKSLQVSLPSQTQETSRISDMENSPDVCNISLQVSLSPPKESPSIMTDDASDTENGEAQIQDENLLYKTAIMDRESSSPEDNLYMTVAEFRSFDENTASPAMALFQEEVTEHRRKSRGVLMDISKDMSQERSLRETEDYFIVSESGGDEPDQISDKENCQPMSASESSEDCAKNCSHFIASKVEEDYFIVSEVDSPRNVQQQTSVRPKVQPKSRAIHKITFSSDGEDVKPLADSESESEEDAVAFKLPQRTKKCVRQQQVLSPVKTTIGPDQMYEDGLEEKTSRKKYRTPRAAAHYQSDSSSDDLESFFEKAKKPQKVKENPNESLDGIIVADDMLTSDEGEEEEQSLFYIRADRDRTTAGGTTRRATRKKVQHSLPKTPEITDDESEGDDEEDDDDDDVVVLKDSPFKTPAALPPKARSQTCKPGVSTRPGFSTPVSSAPRGPPRTPLSPLDRHAPTYDRPNSTGHTPQTCGFLKSLGADVLDSRRHVDAKRFVKHFKKLKEELTVKLFKMYNETVFENKLPEDFLIQWNTRMTKTAGYCTYKKITGKDVQRNARVELSVKVCDSAERVRDTLIHELCHAAVWLFYGKTDGHGHYWKHWARKSNLIHPDLPVISRCHSYDIQTKYTYQCTKCGYKIGRHSKSLDTDKKVCGYCMSPFQLLTNTPRGAAGASGAIPKTPRTPNRFAMFVKENYGTVKKQHGQISHKDVMQKLSAEFALKGKITD